MRLLALLGHNQIHLTRSAAKVARLVLAQPEQVVSWPITLLAKKAGVSEPTVNRFCHTMGCKGYPHFKMALARELASGPPKMNQDVDASDDTAQIIDKIFDSNHACLSANQDICCPVTIDRAVAMLVDARTIHLFGQGASGPVVMDAQHKFMRFSTPTIAHIDHLNQRMAAAGMGDGDVALCVSYTGRTMAMLEVARIARQSGARVLAITKGASQLAQDSDLVVPVEITEDTELHTPMTARIAYLVILDILATVLAVSKGARFSDRLRRIKDSLVATKLLADDADDGGKGGRGGAAR